MADAEKKIKPQGYLERAAGVTRDAALGLAIIAGLVGSGIGFVVLLGGSVAAGEMATTLRNSRKDTGAKE